MIWALVVAHQGASTLIEFVEGGSHVRALVDAQDVAGAAVGDSVQIDAEAVGAALRVSVPWAAHYRVTATPEELEEELHRAGIWTMGDLETRWVKAKAAARRLATRDLTAMLERVRKERER